jgi:hypothetical protein
MNIDFHMKYETAADFCRYLQERRETLRKEAEQCVRDVPDAACPPGHVILQDSNRKETLRMLEQGKKAATTVHHVQLVLTETVVSYKYAS